MDRATIDKLRSLAGFFQALAELPPLLDQIACAEQRAIEAEIRVEKANMENDDLLKVAARVRDELNAKEQRAKEAVEIAEAKAATVVEAATARAKAAIAEASETARSILSDATARADAADKRAATITGEIADKLAEVAKLDKQIAAFREQRRKMLEA